MKLCNSLCSRVKSMCSNIRRHQSMACALLCAFFLECCGSSTTTCTRSTDEVGHVIQTLHFPRDSGFSSKSKWQFKYPHCCMQVPRTTTHNLHRALAASPCHNQIFPCRSSQNRTGITWHYHNLASQAHKWTTRVNCNTPNLNLWSLEAVANAEHTTPSIS